MTSYTVKIEGQTIQLPPEIAATDDGVKRALAPYYPDAANALITRSAEKDGQVEITVIKRAGTKGVLASLLEAPAGRNPAIELYEKIQQRGNELTPLELLESAGEIEAAMNAGANQAQMQETAVERLKRAPAQAAPKLILGF